VNSELVENHVGYVLNKPYSIGLPGGIYLQLHIPRCHSRHECDRCQGRLIRLCPARCMVMAGGCLSFAFFVVFQHALSDLYSLQPNISRSIATASKSIPLGPFAPEANRFR
jgi:hypothetical protein